MASTASFIPSLAERSQPRFSQRTAAITAIITTPTSLARECQVRDIRDARLTRALPRPPSLLSTTDISTEQSRHSPVNPDTASESFSNPVWDIGSRAQLPSLWSWPGRWRGFSWLGNVVAFQTSLGGFHRLTTPTPWRNASSLCGSFLVTPRPSERPLLGLGPMCRRPRGPGCATAVLAALCLSLKREPRSSGSSVSVHVGPWPLFLGPLVPNSPASTPSKCEPTLQSPHPHLRHLRLLWGAHAPATPHLH
ncbi:bcl-2-related protein A1 isoform X3 [Pteropus vampyrus]|uniref:Bcl-2-related protein A1 isoform X3 n=1 Tax=Pteropus vampyrus TaxID=132908 RepID=A0A6P6BL93_PTEVA|nr:bcl-2-related protein A1 isoform X3 [Pteropus vampyrus]XP_023375823.1 bcl-2-related protein A1 isoform X3 [Pteropus vampyrus]